MPLNGIGYASGMRQSAGIRSGSSGSTSRPAPHPARSSNKNKLSPGRLRKKAMSVGVRRKY